MKLYLRTKDFVVSNEEFDLLYDEHNDMLVTQPQPQNISAYYESESYISHTDANTSLFEKLYQKVKQYNLRKKLSLINRFNRGSQNLLDIGAGTGDFLKVAQTAGWKGAGVEPNEKAKAKALEKGMYLNQTLKDLKEEKYTCITLWHVLEHLPDLDKQITNIVNLLAENGTIFIAVPNFKSYDAKHYGSYWAGFDVPRHLWHFSKKAISNLFEAHKFQIVKTIPMPFDAFYVALLSEKYKRGGQNMIRAFFVGLWSNMRAWFTNEYSSHIYILKKTN
ncbi:MAG: class I SAM-dependent methyltransferase [Croceitalea sp.]|nr:class I SAM-dependent methyltransferase [Croceitalea sp.]